MKEQKHQ